MFANHWSSACAFIVILLAAIATVACDYDGSHASNLVERSLDGNGLCNGGRCVRQVGNEASGAMWFGPRLGRRRRSGDVVQSNDEDMGALVDAINGGLRSFMYRDVEDKRHTTKFTPRLGRELVDDFYRKSMDYNFDDKELSRLFDNQRDLLDWQRQLPPPPPPPPFAPRLGRHLLFDPSPRLGRQLSFLQKP